MGGGLHEHTSTAQRVTLPITFFGLPRFFSIFSSIRNASSGSSELLSSDCSSSEMSLSSSSDSDMGGGRGGQRE